MRFMTFIVCSLSTFVIRLIGKINKGLQSYSLVNSQQPKVNEKIDCDVTEWKRTSCNATCGEGYRWKSRAIIVSFYDMLQKQQHGIESFTSLHFSFSSSSYKLAEIPAERRTSMSQKINSFGALLRQLSQSRGSNRIVRELNRLTGRMHLFQMERLDAMQ